MSVLLSSSRAGRAVERRKRQTDLQLKVPRGLMTWRGSFSGSARGSPSQSTIHTAQFLASLTTLLDTLPKRNCSLLLIPLLPMTIVS